MELEPQVSVCRTFLQKIWHACIHYQQDSQGDDDTDPEMQLQSVVIGEEAGFWHVVTVARYGRTEEPRRHHVGAKIYIYVYTYVYIELVPVPSR